MQITIPDLSRLLPHQFEVINDPHRFKCLVWHRRARKTTTALNEILRQSHLKKAVYWHVFPTRTEAKDSIWKDPNMVFSVFPKELILKTNEQELTIYLKNGSIVILKGANDPDALRGAGPFGVVLDEFDTMNPDTWGVVEPIIRANGGWAWFIGTPKGKKQLFHMFQRGQQGSDELKSWRLRASTSGIILPNQLDRAKESMSQALYNQEFETEFLEGEGSVFRGVREVCTSQVEDPIPSHNYVMGVDLAKHQDWTVITVYDRDKNNQVYQERFQKFEWPFQKEKIKAVSQRYNRALVMLDATGIGDPIADDLLRSSVSVEPYKITSVSKKDLIEKLSIYIEQKRITMLPLDENLFEFDNYSYEILPSGHVRYTAPQGLNDDIVVSHALAISSLHPINPKIPTQEMPIIRQEYLRRQHGRQNNDSWNQWLQS